MTHRVLAAVLTWSLPASVACSGGSSTPSPAPPDASTADSSVAPVIDAGPPIDPGVDPTAAAIQASCGISPPTDCPSPPPTYADLAPVIQTHCVPCHDGATSQSQWPLTEYEHVADWADTIRDELIHCEMPPLDGGVVIAADDR